MTYMKAVAVVGVGAVMPEADDARKFWENIKAKRYSIKDVPGERWNASLYYAADPTVEDKTYSKIGSWVQDFNFDPIKWGILMPASVLKNMDDSQKWAIAASRQALLDYGYPERPLDSERVAVIFGNSLAGEKHYRTNLRIHIPQFTTALANLAEFQRLSPEVRESLLNGMEQTIKAQTPDINEDTMPGELANILAGRVANVFNFAGANFVTDAACASSLAAFQAAVDGLMSYQYDAVLAGGVDRNNGAASFVKFSKIGALSPDGSRPYAEGANGFVMGEGAAVFLLKRLEDAERDQDNVYAVIRGIGSSSDGKGKGITAPNPIGQQRAIRRAWQDAGVSLASAGLIEGHGTSTKVGDVVEVNSLAAVFGEAGLPTGSIGLGSVKSNIGHLKSASGAAGLLKVIFALKEQTLPPSANFHAPNPDIKFSETPFYVVDEAQPWEKPTGEVRRAGISSFGFGGTNFHMVVEEHVPGLLTSRSNSVAVPAMQTTEQAQETGVLMAAAEEDGPLYSGMAFAAGENVAALREQLAGIRSDLDKGILPPNRLPAKQELSQQHRMAVSYEDAQQLSDRLERAEKALDSMPETVWQAYSAHGIYYGEGAPGKIAFLFPGQGSQYVNMMRDIHDRESIVAETFREADDVMTPHLGQPLSAYIFEDREDEASQKAAEDKLKDTTITQPAILTANIAMLRLMEKFYIKPDMLIGHSLGEYAALVTAEAITFREGLETVSARGQAMSAIDVEDNGAMAAVSAPIAKVEEVLSQLDGYAVLANVNSPVQSVIGGDTDAIDQAVAAFEAEGIRAVKIPVSHAFHTRIVAPASAVLRKMLDTVKIQAPKMPIAANVTGKLYPTDPDEIRDMLGDHIASPVQFVSGVQTLYEQGCRVFIEAGPKRVLSSLSRDILKDQKGIAIVSTNHPRKGGTASFHEALCGLYAAGVGGEFEALAPSGSAPEIEAETPIVRQDAPRQAEGGPYPPLTGSVVVSGAGLGLPGREHAVFEDDNIQRILKGDSRIEALPEEVRQEMIYRRVTRLEKGENGAEWVPIDSIGQTTKLAGQRGRFDLADEFGMKPERADVLDISTKLAIAAGIEALRDAGIPLVMGYKQTSTGSYLPQRWMLPKSMADETGVIFGSAFPGLDELSKEAGLYHHHQSLQGQIKLLREVLAETPAEHQPRLKERIQVLQAEMAALNYGFDRKFIFRVLNMGHSQFAEYIGARGPNSAVNAACATTTHAIALAEDWIRAGRCRRVVVVAGDDVTGGDLVNWIGTGLLATGAATTEGDLRKAALPFDLRRNGMIMGMGAAALVVEAQDAVSERGMRGIAEVLATDIANSAFHGTRLDVEHVSEVMDRLMTKAEAQFGVERHAIAARTMFMSHETYTPARGGSAAAEIRALRHTFGEQADQVMITNTKGYTGHTMGVGVEDVVAIKGLEYSLVPPIANLDGDFQPDPDLGNLNLTREAGQKDVDYALRLGAGFGSQIAMALFRRIPGVGERVEDQTGYRDWLAALAGHPSAETEIVHRTLRIMDQGKPIVPAKGSSWRYGTPPNGWADRPEDNREAMPELAAAPVAVQTAAPVQNVDAEEVKDFVLGLVSEKTGYPIEILDLGLDLEADLGVDTVKQAELFAAVRENYGIARQEDLRLVDYNTLEKVIGFVLEMAGGGEPAAEAVAVAEPAAAPVAVQTAAPVQNVDAEEVKDFVLGLVSEKTGYPIEILDLGLDLEADLGVDTVKQAELFAAVRENYGIARQEDLRLVDYNTLEKVIGFVLEMAGGGEPAAEAVAVAEPAAAPVAVQTAAPVQNVDAEEVKDFVLGLVSEKTGYPIEILDLGLDLEADLGVDTVKQAELFAAVRENYGIARQEDLRLVDYNTLEKVIGFVLEMAGGGEPAAEAVAVAEPAAVPEELSGSGSVPRRVPVPMLRPKLALCLPTGLGLDDADRVLVVEEVEGTGVMLGEKLAERGAEVLRITEMDSLVEQARRWAEERPVSGVYYLSGMSPEPLLDEITIEGWRGLLESRLEPLFELMKMLPEDVFLLTAIQSDGLQGYSSSGGVSTGAGIAGFSKALAMERPGSVIKTLDFGSGMDAAEMADRLLAETLHDPDAVEIGYHLGQRFSITLVEQPWTEIPQFDLGVEPVFLVSGGTGGITLPIVEDLAMRTHGKFFLIGRSPLPAADDPDLALLRKSREDLQSKWMQASLSGEEKLTPVQIRGKLDAFERLAATREAMNAIRAAGGKTEYLRGDVSDPASMEAVVSQVKRDAGRIDVLIHAAGYERSRKLRRKPLEEFRQIIDVKATGFVNLYKAMQQTGGLPRAMVLFSSIAGRYGNTGQVDYSAANDLLARFASGLKSKHPAMRVITLDWGAWAEVGMASRGNIPWLMSQAGIEMIDPAEGAPIVYRELVYGQGHEALFAGSLGALAETASKEGGLDLEAANAALREGNPPHVMLSSVSGYSPTEGMTLEVTLNPEDEPFLHDHSLNGTPLLPGVMGIEGFAVAAQHIASVMGQAGDSYRVAGLADIRFLTPFKFYRNEPRHILWKALPLWREDHLSVAVTLESISPSRLKTENEELVRHFSGVVGLQPTDQPIPASSAAPPDWNGHYTLPDDLIYQLYFHGPAFQVLEGVQRSGSQLLGKLKPNLPEFTSRPITLDTTPVLLELCLQTAGIWEIGLTGALSLPHSIGSVRLYHREVNGLPVFAEVSKREDAGGLVFNSRVVDAKGQVYLEMENYRTVVTPYPVEVSQREPLQRLVNGD